MANNVDGTSNVSYDDGADENSDFNFSDVGDTIRFIFNENIDGFKSVTISDADGSQTTADLGKATFEVKGSDIVLTIADNSVLESGDIVTFTGVMDLVGNTAENIEFTLH